MASHRHLGVYACIVKDKQILLIEKARGPYRGRLDLPGGSLEFGETIEDALKREVLEETGLGITNFNFVQVATTVFEYQTEEGNNNALYHIGVIYDVNVNQGHHLKEDGDGEDSLGAKWYNIEKLNESSITPFVNEFVLKKFNHQKK